MLIEIGSKSTIVPEHIDGPESPVVARRVSGEQVLQLRLDDEEASVYDMLKDVSGAVALHMEERPLWIECPNEDLLSLLCDHYGLNKKQNHRPPTWGQNLGPREPA
jgi:hypothetical protein